MQNRSPSSTDLQYRHYNLPLEFPSFAFLGDRWILPDHADSMHFHNCMEIGYCLSGHGTFYVEQKALEFSEGDICIIPENTIHISCSDSRVFSHWEYILFDPKLMFPTGDFHLIAKDSRLLFDDPQFSNLFSKQEHPALIFFVCRMFEEFYHHETGYRDALRGLFMAFITEYLRICPDRKISGEARQNLRIYPAILHIRSFYSQKITVPGLAALCGLSEPHFRRIFEEIIHLPPLDYIHHLRIRQACYFLVHTNTPVSEISKMVGFSTLSSFNRQFQMVTGTSPRKWKAKNRDSMESHRITSLDSGEDMGFFAR